MALKTEKIIQQYFQYGSLFKKVIIFYCCRRKKGISGNQYEYSSPPARGKFLFTIPIGIGMIFD
jgi:hypothetical protein